MEVAPSYDHCTLTRLDCSILAKITSIAVEDLVHEFLSMLMAGSPITNSTLEVSS